ncbi:MAG: type II toxin-antitoxin system mRNA interferase toxin, RelE/StbE family [Gammaproteobacteria bacterium]
MALTEALPADPLLNPKSLDHPLSGEWRDHRDCQVRSDWVLIDRKTKWILQLIRSGSHNQLGIR